jgi:NAD(P)-dependent dehydrogenase (short-subunit alcohol dehydrogenase family)
MKTYLITGASRGLGLEVARLLAQRGGANLVLVARGGTALRRVAEELSQHVPVLGVEGDVGQDAELIVERAVERFGPIDVLLNNASTIGPSPMPPVAEYPWEALQDVLHTNVLAPLHLIQLTLPQLAPNGLIVNITSDAAVQAYPGWGGYGLSKAALEHLSRTLAAEHPDLRVLVIDPGDMNTQMHQEAEPGVDLSGLPGPEKVAPAVVARLDQACIGYARVQAQGVLVEA